MQSHGISTWTKSCPDISHSVSPVTVTNNGKQLPVAVNVNVSFTLILLIDLLSCTRYNAFVPRFIIDDFVARVNFCCSSHVPSNIYSVVSSVETINSGRTGNTDVPHALETHLSNIFVGSGRDLISSQRSESSLDSGMKWVLPMRARLLMEARREFSAANLIIVFWELLWEMEMFS
jgi:hypothetical protein